MSAVQLLAPMDCGIRSLAALLDVPSARSDLQRRACIMLKLLLKSVNRSPGRKYNFETTCPCARSLKCWRKRCNGPANLLVKINMSNNTIGNTTLEATTAGMINLQGVAWAVPVMGSAPSSARNPKMVATIVNWQAVQAMQSRKIILPWTFKSASNRYLRRCDFIRIPGAIDLFLPIENVGHFSRHDGKKTQADAKTCGLPCMDERRRPCYGMKRLLRRWRNIFFQKLIIVGLQSSGWKARWSKLLLSADQRQSVAVDLTTDLHRSTRIWVLVFEYWFLGTGYWVLG